MIGRPGHGLAEDINLLVAIIASTRPPADRDHDDHHDSNSALDARP
jgi:hypothetical protein